MLRSLLLAALFTLLSGCTGLASLADSLNERQVQSCIQWQGHISSLGGGVQVRGVTATGGVPLASCVGG